MPQLFTSLKAPSTDCLIAFISIAIIVSGIRLFVGGLPTKLSSLPQNWCDKSPSCCIDDTNRFNKFLWLVSDAHPSNYAPEMKEAYKHNSVLYHSMIPGIKYSHSIYSGWITGNYPTNFVGETVRGDTLIKRIHDSTNYKMLYHGPEWSFGVIANLSQFDEADTFVESHETPTFRCYPQILGYDQEDDREIVQQRWASYLDKHAAKGQSMILHSAVFDHAMHIRPRYHPETEAIAARIDRDHVAVKKWIDEHPEYLLIISSDHGVDEGPGGSILHGTSFNGNNGYFMLYNPTLPDLGEHTIHSCDFASILPQYLKNVEIPVPSIGVPNLEMDTNERYQCAVSQSAYGHIHAAKNRGMKLRNTKTLELVANNKLPLNQAIEAIKASKKQLSSKSTNPAVKNMILYFMLNLALCLFFYSIFIDDKVLAPVKKILHRRGAISSPITNFTISNDNDDELFSKKSSIPRYIVIFSVLVLFVFSLLPAVPTLTPVSLISIITRLLYALAIFYLPELYQKKVVIMFIIDSLISMFWTFISGTDNGEGPFDQLFSSFFMRIVFYSAALVAFYYLLRPDVNTSSKKKAFIGKMMIISAWIMSLIIYLSTKSVESLWVTKYFIHISAFCLYVLILTFVAFSILCSVKWSVYDVTDLVMPVIMFTFTTLSATPRKQLILLILVWKWISIFGPVLVTARYASSLTFTTKKNLSMRTNNQITQTTDNLKAARFLTDPSSPSYFVILLSLGLFSILYDFTVNLSATPSLSVYPPAGRVGIKSDNTFPIPSAIGMASHKFGICIVLTFLFWSFTSGVMTPQKSIYRLLHPLFMDFFAAGDDSLFFAETSLVFPFNYCCAPHHFASLLVFSMCALLTTATNSLFYSWYYEVDYEQPFAMALVVCAMSIMISLCNFISFCVRLRRQSKTHSIKIDNESPLSS